MESILTTINWQQIFQRVPGLWMILAVGLAVLGPVHLPIFWACYYTFLHFILLLNNTRYALSICTFYYKSVEHATTDWVHKYCIKTASFSPSDPIHDLPFDHVNHLIVLPNYKESLSILREALDVLSSHDIARTQYTVCLAMEENEAGAAEKALALEEMYADAFFSITHTIHPRNLPNEIRGKGSNVAWAVKSMAYPPGTTAGINGKRHSQTVVTVMDVDNCFAQDYFYAVNYYYTTATPEERKIMMFTPGCVFDRNSNDVPALVRVVDFGWSIGSMSNLYQNSPAKLPLSSYSISMDLCILVDFWDTGAEAIGEDCHMYLKCFFSTQGKLIVKTIFSPVSVCNVQSSGTGIVGYMKGLKARYVQGKRHLWASLDTGYMLRRTLLGIVAPEYDASINGGVIPDKNTPRSEIEGVPLPKLAHLFHRVLEAHTFMCQIFVFILAAAVIAPNTGTGVLWGMIGGVAVHPYVNLAMVVGLWVQRIILLPNIATIYYYHAYHKWVGFERWVLQDTHLLKSSLGANYGSSSFSLSYVSPRHRNLKVHRLGKRPHLYSRQDYPRFIAEFATGSIISAALFYLLPQLHAQISHLYTNELDYMVAEKPEGGDVLGNEEEDDVRSFPSVDEGYGASCLGSECDDEAGMGV